MSKANRTCYCCEREYYYCPSCPSENKNPNIYTMFDSELCRDIFNTLVSESTKKITTLECKKRLVEMGVNENTVLKASIRKHVDRVMSCEEEKFIENEINVESTEEVVTIELVEEEKINKANKTRTRKTSSSKNKKNSEVD